MRFWQLCHTGGRRGEDHGCLQAMHDLVSLSKFPWAPRLLRVVIPAISQLRRSRKRLRSLFGSISIDSCSTDCRREHSHFDDAPRALCPMISPIATPLSAEVNQSALSWRCSNFGPFTPSSLLKACEHEGYAEAEQPAGSQSITMMPHSCKPCSGCGHGEAPGGLNRFFGKSANGPMVGASLPRSWASSASSALLWFVGPPV